MFKLKIFTTVASMKVYNLILTPLSFVASNPSIN